MQLQRINNNILVAALPDGWEDGEKAVAPKTVETAKTILASIQALGEPNIIISPTRDGEILIEWKKNSVGLSVENECCDIWSPHHMEQQFTIPKDLVALVKKVHEAFANSNTIE